MKNNYDYDCGSKYNFGGSFDYGNGGDDYYGYDNYDGYNGDRKDCVRNESDGYGYNYGSFGGHEKNDSHKERDYGKQECECKREKCAKVYTLDKHDCDHREKDRDESWKHDCDRKKNHDCCHRENYGCDRKETHDCHREKCEYERKDKHGCDEREFTCVCHCRICIPPFPFRCKK